MPNRMKRIVLTLAAIVIVAGGGGLRLQAAGERPQIPPVLTLPQALEIAFAQSTALRRAASQVWQAEGQARQARAALLPQLSVTAVESLQTENLKARGIDIPFAPSRVGPFQAVDARARLAQSVLDVAARRRNQAGEARLDASLDRQANSREQVAWGVVVAYAQALRSQQTVATLRQQASLAVQLSDIADERFTQGVASAVDVKRSSQQVNNIEQALSEAENALTAAKLQLANLLHAQITADYELAPLRAGSDALPAPEAALAAAKDARPDYRAAAAQLRAAELSLRAARSQRYPTLQFLSHYGQSGRKPFENLNTFQVQGALTVPVFTGGRIAAEAREAEGRREEAHALLEEAESQVETDVLTALAAVAAARREIELAEATTRLAREELDLASARFTSGVADNTEVVNAQDRLARSEENHIRALFRWNLAQADFYRSIGAAEKTFRQ